MAATDWSKTALGPVDGWSTSLRNMVRFLLANRFPLLLWWGPDLCQLYNDAYRPVLGAKHPRSMGQPARECWPEIWDVIGPLATTPYEGGPATWKEDQFLEPNRHGYPEESYFTFAYSAVHDDSTPTGIGGVLATVHETTRQIVEERRVGALRDLGAGTADAKTADEACASLARVLAYHQKDIPFALLYLVDHERSEARLAGIAGAYATDETAPPVVDLSVEGAERGWPLATVYRSGRRQLVAGIARWCRPVPAGPWSDPPTRAMVLPIASNVPQRLAGLLVLGISAHLEFDALYESFFELATSQVATAIANARAFEEERQRAEALAELDRAKTAFFSNVSHEFRTPLTLMLGPIEDALASPDLPADERERLDVAHRNSLRLLKLVNTLLDFSRIEAGRVQASFEPTDVGTFTRDVASNFRSAMTRAGLDYRVRCRRLSEPVHVDREMWEKVVLNLLSNAFKFTLEGHVEVRLEERPDEVELVVADTGCGIPAGEIAHVFQRFHRVEGTRGRTYEGTGIGLALVQELVKLHGGGVTVESQLDRGSTFRVTLRKGTAHLPADRIGAERQLASTALGATPFVEEALRWLPDATSEDAGAPPRADALFTRATRRDEPRARIIVADDNADMRQYVVRLLSDQFDVSSFRDGEAAVRAARARPPDLVVTDVMMPGLDGFGVLRALRGDPATADVPVVMLSARAGDEARVEGLEAGADDYLVKPFSARELVARVSSNLALARARRESAEERARLLGREEAARRQAELERENLTALFLQTPTPIIMLRGPDYRVTLANPSALTLWRKSEADILDKPLFDAIPELEDVRRWKGFLDAVMQTGEPFVRTNQRADIVRGGVREERFFSVALSPVRTVDGDVDGIFVISLDVTAEIVARREAERANQAKDEFLAMLGHELRNPLAAVRNAVATASYETSRRERALEIARRQTDQLGRLIDDLLDVARITQGRIALRRRPVSVAHVMQEAIEAVRDSIRERGHELTVRLPPGSVRVDGDPARLEQVAVNLLQNAAKYTPAGGRIAVSGDVEGHEVVLRVQDSGIGIAPDMLGKVFDLFAQVSPGLDRAQGGLGIGLTITRQLVELHGGRIDVRSDGIGHGAEFVVRVPVLAASAPDAETASAPAEGREPPLVSAHILVVEDNRDTAETMEMLLELLGHRVRIAHDGIAALDAARAMVPDLMLVDIGLPGMDGYEVAQHVRGDRRLDDVVLVALTGYGRHEDKQRAVAAGFDHHLVKPIDADGLGDLIRGLAGRRKKRRAGLRAVEARRATGSA